MALSAGDKLGAYEIVTTVGAGGMGEVYRAHDSRLGRHVGVKISAEQFTEGFEREAREKASRSCGGEGNRQHPGPERMLDLSGVWRGGTCRNN